MAAKSEKNSLLKGRWPIWILSFAFALMAGFGVLTILGSASEQATYYVMAQSVPAGTKLTDANVEQRVTNLDGVPATALTLADLTAQPLFTKVPLQAGDVLTGSVVDTGYRIAPGIPAGYVAASLQVEPQDAAAGKIRAGDYVDIAAVNENDAKVVLHNVLVLDVNSAPTTIPQAANEGEVAADTGNASLAGTPLLYTFAVSPKDFATLALLRGKQVYLAISQGADGAPIDASVTQDEIFAKGAVPDANPTPVPSPTTTDDTAVAPTPSPTAPLPTTGSPSPAPPQSVSPAPAPSPSA